jgi:hypothetical protein
MSQKIDKKNQEDDLTTNRDCKFFEELSFGSRTFLAKDLKRKKFSIEGEKQKVR